MSSVVIIAEAGVNHNGSMELAKKLIDAAADAGADYVKFQSFKTDNLVSKNAQKANYQKETTDSTESQYDMIKKLELSESNHVELLEYCKKKEIGFLSSPFDIESINYLASLNIDFFKIPSGELTNLPFLRELKKFNKKIVLSTGMATLAEIKETLEIVGKENITVLHCNTEYPTPIIDVNLRAMKTIQDELGVEVGYSDHTLGIEVSIAAVALGAKVIEKHFTLDRKMEGPDHRASLDPSELKQMVLAIRNIESALGNGIKEPSPSEKRNISVARKSIVAKIDISLNDTFTKENITTKRPGSGLSPMKWDQVIGKKAKRNFTVDEEIEL